MLRITALRMFRREYFHGVRNGLTSRQAADQAITRIKAVIQDALAKRQDLSPLEREERWGEILGNLVEFQILLTGLPIDQARLEDIPQKDREALEEDARLLLEDIHFPRDETSEEKG